eukprot:TRINITY_DN7120_c0_g1_i1.p1 TRINITY_DN7120_c0_g1~~TRINITY_DN7120_c0_g1_i1.p1  ORF type:complete len:915 (-),score=187.32 TRINITY_DN7120_c0_g1_i1:51-2558(-)
MPKTGVQGHSGTLVYGEVSEKKVLCLAGRVHLYEGHEMFILTFMTRLVHQLGCSLLIATNAAGGSGPGMKEGSVMVITNHINMWRRNPLSDITGAEDLAPRIGDASEVYSKRLAKLAVEIGKEKDFPIYEGIYGSTCGPNYETALEVRSLTKQFGVSAFGMSTVPETTLAGVLGMETFGLSLCTNLAAGICEETLTHEAVQQVANISGPRFVKFMVEFLARVELKPDAELNIYKHQTDGSSHIIKLPQPIAEPATEAQVEEAVGFVRKTFDKKTSQNVLVFPSSYESLELVEDAHSITLKDIPHFPDVSLNAHCGRLSIGQIKGTKALIFIVSHLIFEGLAAEEATFIARVFKGIGVSRVFYSVLAGENKTTTLKGNVVLLQDCIDWTTIHPTIFTRPTMIENQFLLDTAPLSCDDEMGSLFEKKGIYMHFPGPTSPTLGELNAASKLGANVTGTSTLGLVYSCQSLGLKVIGLAFVTFTYGTVAVSKDVFKDVTQLAEKSLSLLLKNIAQKSISPPDNKGAPFKAAQQITYGLPKPVSQGDVETLNSARQFLVNRVPELHVTSAQSSSSVPASPTIKVGLLITDPNFPLHNFKIRHSIPFQEIPFLDKHGAEGGKILILETAAEHPSLFIACFGARFLNEGVLNEEIAFPARLLSSLEGLEAIVFLSPVCSIASDINTGDLISVEDHLNLSGRCVLFGSNKWGDRFFDCGEVYSGHLRNIANSVAKKESGLKYHENIPVAYVVGPILRSSAQLNLPNVLGAKAVTTGLCQEVLVVHHMRKKILALGYVVGQIPVDSNPAPSTSAGFSIHPSESINSFVSKLVDQIDSFCSQKKV